MFDNSKHREAGQTVFMGSMKGLADTMAVGAALFGTGPIHSASVDWVTDYATRQYGSGLEDPTSVVWFVLVAATTFFVARASIATLILMGGLAVAARVFA